MMINRLTISLLAKEFEDYFVGTKCSINFARIVCILCKDSPLILRKLQSIHAKSSLLSHLSVADSYYSKRVFLSLYYTLYIKSIDMDLLEFEFIVNSFLLP